MPDAAAHKWYVNALALLAILLAGAAAVAQLVGWKGRWALMLFIASIGLGIVVGIVEKVVVPRIDGKRERVRQAEEERRRTDEETRRREAEQQQARAEDERARAVELLLFAGEGETELTVMNKYRHEVTEIRIECWPLRRTPGDTSAWPEFIPGGCSDDVIDCSVMAGGGQIIEVPRLSPSANPGTATGRSVGSWRLVPGCVTEMEFTVDWLDHDRRGRRLWGVANLADFAVITTVMLNPPDPLTSPRPD